MFIFDRLFAINAGAVSCKELLEQGNTLSGWYTVYTASKKPISVFCDMHTDGGGWLVSDLTNPFLFPQLVESQTVVWGPV